MFDSLLEDFDELRLKPGEYVIVAGGALAARNLRDTRDLDVLVTREAFKRLLQKQRLNEEKNTVIQIGKLEIGYTWRGNESAALYYLEHAESINGRSYLLLEELLEMKREMRREKDREDCVRIRNYLNR